MIRQSYSPGLEQISTEASPGNYHVYEAVSEYAVNSALLLDP